MQISMEITQGIVRLFEKTYVQWIVLGCNYFRTNVKHPQKR